MYQGKGGEYVVHDDEASYYGSDESNLSESCQQP